MMFKFWSEHENPVLITNGDCIDLTRSARPDKREEQFFRAAKSFTKWIAILGNHEYPYYRAAGIYEAAGAHKICKRYRFTSGGQLFVVEHGHHFDPKCSGNMIKYNQVAIKALTFADLLFKTDVQEWLRENRWIDRKLRSRSDVRGAMQRALAEYDGKDAFVVIGHRHAPYINYNSKFCDVGDWLKHKSYATIVNGEIKLEVLK